MRVAFQVEGPTDLRVFSTFVSVILGSSVEVEEYRKRIGGVGEVFRTLEKSMWDAWSKGCRGAVISVDADDTTRHAQHPSSAPNNCRYCEVQTGLPALPPRPSTPAFTFAVAVPVEALEAWLLQFGHLVDSRSPGPPQNLPRKEAKKLLWGAVKPAPSQIDRVLNKILPALDASAVALLAEHQPSFAAFQAEVAAW